MKVLILDDSADRHQIFAATTYERWDRVQAWTAAQAIEALKTQTFDLVTLDHDLADAHYLNLKADHEDTGRAVSRWMAEHMTERPRVIVHSWNIDGGGNMVMDLRDAGFDVTYRMFGMPASYSRTT